LREKREKTVERRERGFVNGNGLRTISQGGGWDMVYEQFVKRL
jgi:hypothetical protein